MQSPLDQALELKQEGNGFFKQCKYKEAIKCYEEGIAMCPPEKKDEIAKFYQNLSAVYDRMVGFAASKKV